MKPRTRRCRSSLPSAIVSESSKQIRSPVGAARTVAGTRELVESPYLIVYQVRDEQHEIIVSLDCPWNTKDAMKAIMYREFGPPEVLHYELPDPVPGPAKSRSRSMPARSIACSMSRCARQAAAAQGAIAACRRRRSGRIVTVVGPGVEDRQNRRCRRRVPGPRRTQMFGIHCWAATRNSPKRRSLPLSWCRKASPMPMPACWRATRRSRGICWCGWASCSPANGCW